ncbi:hypothetical protein [Teredinibacter purpureus]|uniref:hypothetical protein n=1 Tax=Teredinibacter purpureus TaxID=2731756 RepID=UPI0005F7A671|nr:hypothetical protein [Teredinibacter purpureus]
MCKIKKTILIFLLLVISVVFITCRVAIEKEQKGKLEIDVFAIESAFSVAEHVKTYKECPDRPLGWKGAIESEKGDLELKKGYVRLIYQCKADFSAYISVFYSFDSEAVAYLESNGSIKWVYGHFTAKKEVVISTSESVLSVLNSIK